MNKEKPLRKGLSVQEEMEIVAKGQALKDLRHTPGWPVLVDVFDKAVEADKDMGTLDLSLADSKLGREIRIRREVEKRVRHVFNNVVTLITGSDTLIRMRRLKNKPNHILHVEKPK